MPAPKTKKAKLLWKKRIAEGLLGNTPWNKGKRFVEVYSQARKRKSRKYYLAELKRNSARAQKYGYGKIRLEQATELNRLRAERCGFYGRQNWDLKEIKTFKENWNQMRYEVLAKKMGRSYSSILHKAQRLGLVKYHKWL